MLATIVDFAALWKILLAALAVGVGLTAMFGEGVAALSRMRAGHSAVANSLVLAVAGLACAAALVAGFIAMTHK
jgi:hypothetical protein